MTRALFLITALLALSPSAHAKDHTGQFSVGAGVGPLFAAPWAQDPFKDAVGPGVRGTLFARSHYENAHSGWELALDGLRFGGNHLNSVSVLAAYFYRWKPEARLHPMVSVGIGHAWLKNYFSKGDYNAAIFRLRAGVEYEWKPGWDLALHVDHFSVFKDLPADPNMHGLVPTLSVIRYFGHARPATDAAAVTPPAALPAPTVAAESAPDTDGDGVPDAADRCPNTPSGEKANELGCGPQQAFELTPGIRFAFGKADLPRGSDDALGEAADLLKRYPNLVAEVQGHTDTLGTEEQNDRLSLARAEVVRERLVRSFRVRTAQLTVKAFGSTRPVAASTSEEQHARNRRVSLRFRQR